MAHDLLSEGIGTIAAIYPDDTDLEQRVSLLCQSEVSYLLLDPRTPDTLQGGQARAELFCNIQAISSKPVILAGGITRENIISLLELTHAGIVDVMTGSETSPGHKDTEKLIGILQCKKAPQRR
jgi:phosphoribosylanthranilate isomerase